MTGNLKEYCQKMAFSSKKAFYQINDLSTIKKNNFLETLAEVINDRKSVILEENQRDIQRASEMELSSAMIDRLRLTEKRINNVIKSIIQVKELPDPVGRILEGKILPNGLRLTKVSVPIGSILIIYESRPNVTIECAILCFKASNTVILRGGKESFNTNMILYRCIQEALEKNSLPLECIQFVETTERECVDILLQQSEYLDLVIPRGGRALIEKITNISRIPVIKHYQGICHIYVHEDADLDKALKVIINAKVSRPSVCNAVETLLINEKIANKFLPILKKELEKHKVEIRGCEKTCSIIDVKRATEEDWYTEYLDLIVSVKVVPDIDSAIFHINHYGSAHSDAIMTSSIDAMNRFIQKVDSSSVYVNASTRFTDGGEFGMGAEIGISTDRIHARGPMGLNELTTYKYIIIGDGHIRE